MKALEKIYLYPYSTDGIYEVETKPLEGTIEYIRADAFMKKAENFLEMLGYGFTITDNITHANYDKEQLIADFRNYIEKGEKI
jgi:hypothetical protein